MLPAWNLTVLSVMYRAFAISALDIPLTMRLQYILFSAEAKAPHIFGEPLLLKKLSGNAETYSFDTAERKVR